MPVAVSALPPADLFPPTELLPALLDLAPAGLLLLTPVPDAAGQVVDFAFAYLNPAAQRLLGLPPAPAVSFQQYVAPTGSSAELQWCLAAYAAQHPAETELGRPLAGASGALHLAARRVGAGLLLVCTPAPADQRQPRPQAAAPISPAPASPTALEMQHRQLYDVLLQAPAMICIFRGPEHVFEFVNPSYQALVGERLLLGLPIAHAMPELEGQVIFGWLDEVYQTGKTLYATEQLVQLDHANDGRPDLERRYYNFSYSPRRDAAGTVNGIMVFAYEVTAQVQARNQVQVLNEELAVTIEELRAANEEFHTNNTALQHAQHALQELNQSLEARVQGRTRELQLARTAAEQQQQQLQGLFMQAPIAIVVLEGPELVYQLVNPTYQRIFPGRRLLGRPLLQALPELADTPLPALLRQVYATGTTQTGQELALRIARREGGPLEEIYCSYTYQARRNSQGEVDGIMAFVYEVTAQVQTHRQAEALQAQVQAATRRQMQVRETFYQIFEETPAAICIQRGPEHRYEYVNSAYQAFFPQRQLLGRTVAEALPETVEAGIVDLLDHVYETGNTYFGHELPLLIAQPDGQPPKQMYFTFTYQPYREEGKIVGISTFAYDVAEQVEARRRGEAQQAQLRQLFEQAPVAIALLRGPDHMIETANSSICRIWERNAADVLGRPLFEVLPELVEQGIPLALEEVWQTGQPFVAQERPIELHRAHGPDTMYFNFVFQPLLDSLRHVNSVVLIATDVTEQVRARRAVEEREQYFRRMTDNVPAMVWVTDPAGYCTYLNQQWYNFTGQSEAEALGLGWTNAVHADYAAQAGTAFMEANAQQVPFHCLYQIRRHDGQYRWAIDYGHPHFDAAGQYEGMVGTVIDVHEQKLAEHALQRLTKKLRRARDEAQGLNTELQASNEQLVRTNVDLDNFIYTASHDLKAPITNIEGLLHALRSELPATSQEGEVPFIMELMQGSVDRFKDTIAHLSDVTRLQKEHDQPTAQVALADVVEDVRLDLAPLLAETDAHLEIALSGCPTVSFAKKNLRSVVYNLLSNALKYRHPDRRSHVRVRCFRQADYLVLEVQDNGLGLEADQQLQLFTMFRRLHTHVEGSGIGLYMVKKIVDNAGGRIEVQSEPGIGSTFSVFFPCPG